jgi:hypothetical protein
MALKKNIVLLGLSLLACLPIAVPAGAEARLASDWSPQPLNIDLSQGGWILSRPLDNQEFVVRALNDGSTLYLFFATVSDQVKIQLLGAFHQEFTLWFDPGGRQRYLTGLRLDFHHMPGVGFPRTSAEQREYWQAATRELALLQPGREGFPKILADRSGLVQWQSDMSHGMLTYALKIPLKALDSQGWGIGVDPGGSLGLFFECSGISPEAAMIEVEREYQEEALGWGWSSNGYGPKKEGIGRGKSYGLGDYDMWGLDNSLYSTHGLYQHSSWSAVPTPLNLKATLWLAVAPQAGPP